MSVRVTVLIPVRNRERYVAEAIESALAQTFRALEVLVVDDASSDGSRDVVRAFSDPRVRLVENETHLGIPRARNRGVDLARGEYLAFLDSDDCALPERLQRQVGFLDANPDHGAVGAWIEWMDEEGRPQGRFKRKATSPEQIAAERLFRSCLENSSATARTDLLRKFRHREHFELGSDYDLWARMAAEHPLAALPEVLVRRRAHKGRTTRGREARIKALRLEIFAEQLSALGLAFDAEDLERHYLLRRMHKMGFRPDPPYLAWAERWLGSLRTANGVKGLYPEPAFGEVLGGFWLKACWNAGAPGFWRFWRSPLRRGSWAPLLRGLRRRLPHAPARSGA
ncbi:MAG: glycosyltransferase family A protein [Myxococcota bacterium]|nr:glycosyltransferase family A protein [Myxococcota bacterium]